MVYSLTKGHEPLITYLRGGRSEVVKRACPVTISTRNLPKV